MGVPVPVAEPEWSGTHKGLCLYVSRLLGGAWDEAVVVPLRSSPQLVRSRLSAEALQVGGCAYGGGGGGWVCGYVGGRGGGGRLCLRLRLLVLGLTLSLPCCLGAKSHCT
jgi:hypothetical protein